MSATYTSRDSALKTGGRGRGPVDHRDYGGGGGGGRGDGAPNYGERLRRYRLGMALALVAVVMLFVTFTTTFLMRAQVGSWNEAAGAYVRDWQPVQLPMTLLVINTLFLVASSVTLELARREAAERALLGPLRSIPGIIASRTRPIPWLPVTLVLGSAFLAGQVLAWRALAAHRVELYNRPSSSFFYVLTGAHAIHLFGGLLALLYAAISTVILAKPLEVRRIVVDVTAWYWHVMTLLWLYIFALLALAQ